jgi:dienelactone hydrolase
VPIEGGATNLYLPPLKEKTQYLVVVTSAVTDPQDRPMRRSTLMDLIFTFNGDLCTPATDLASCTSRVPGVSNADAAGLQRLRQSVGPALDQLGLRSCANNATCAVLAYTVRTQSVKDVTKLLAAAPYGIEQAATQAVFAPAGTADFSPAPFGLPAPGTPEFGLAFPNVARFVQANVPTVYAIQGSTGAFDPAFATWTPAQVAEHLQQLPVLVAIPKCAAPPCVAPLAVLQHGINGARYQMLAIADKLASKGFVAAAIDLPYHGDRAYCTSNAQCVAPGGGEGVCTPDPTLQTPSDTTAPGRCGAGETLALDPARLSTVASGNFVVSSNFFRMRDGIRQSALDMSALVLALARPPAAAYPLQPASNDLAAALAAAGVGINPTQVYFAGISLGGIIGTSAVATNPRFTRAALNVAGGTIVDVLTTAPAFADARTALFASLGLDPAKVSPILPDGSPNPNFDPAQAARLAQTLAIAKWIVDPADPVNYAANLTTKTFDPALQPFVTGGLGSATTQAYAQLMVGDTVVPNPTNRLLYGLAGIPTTTYDPTQIPAASRHGLVLANFTSPATPVGEVIREDLASFLATTTPPPATRTIP